MYFDPNIWIVVIGFDIFFGSIVLANYLLHGEMTLTSAMVLSVVCGFTTPFLLFAATTTVYDIEGTVCDKFIDSDADWIIIDDVAYPVSASEYSRIKVGDKISGKVTETFGYPRIEITSPLPHAECNKT